jgi:hypothetical protein
MCPLPPSQVSHPPQGQPPPPQGGAIAPPRGLPSSCTGRLARGFVSDRDKHVVAPYSQQGN